jgi:saccharopine dehydrogenase-like NADP-dependent oxidoreductase
MRVTLVGAGAVGRRLARQLSASPGLDRLTIVDRQPTVAAAVADALGARAGAWSPELMADSDVLVLAAPGDPRPFVEAALVHGAHAVCTNDSLPAVRSLLALDPEARERDVCVVVGAGFVPGFSCLLARHAAAGFDQVDEVHVAKLGTGGPACARNHHNALAKAALDWRHGAWVPRTGGSGRELCWFPDPVGGQDCYRAALPDALLLQPVFPGVRKVTARVAATRRDRLTAALPMLRRPHPEGAIGAARVEVRGTVAGTTEVKVLGAIDRPAVAAGAVAAVAAIWAADSRLARPGAAGLAELVEDPVPFLHELADRGVRAAAFEGAGA